jgi:hypothetical protein
MYKLQYTGSLLIRELRVMNSQIRQKKSPQDGALNPKYYLHMKHMVSSVSGKERFKTWG